MKHTAIVDVELRISEEVLAGLGRDIDVLQI